MLCWCAKRLNLLSFLLEAMKPYTYHTIQSIQLVKLIDAMDGKCIENNLLIKNQSTRVIYSR